ncbi:MAG: hypothetical protein FK730_03385 [Asgard group archaeon]|nr:hypothetical protein [Asgard group archaeon]
MSEKDKYLPLIVYAIDPISIIVIDNTVIGFRGYGFQEHYPSKAFQTLRQFYANPRTRKDIPEKFHKYLEFKEVYNNRYMDSGGYFWLVGNHDEGNCHQCLHIEVEITEKKEKQPALIKNFAFVHMEPWNNKAELTPIEKEVRLSSKEAFFLFANICTTALLTEFWYSLIMKKSQSFMPEIIREGIREYRQRDPTNVPELNQQIRNFAIDYLEYLLEELQQKKITPEEVLWASGMRLLIFLIEEPIIYQYIQKVKKELIENYQQLTFNQKLMYFCLIRISTESDFYRKEAREFFKRNKELVKQIKKELWKNFPESDGKIREI